MNVRITQLDGSMPNLALMKLASYHRSKGDDVHFTRSITRDLFEPEYDVVYGSAIFQFSQINVMQFQRQWPKAIIGGTGTPYQHTVEDFIGEHDGLDYSLYPEVTYSIGFTQRGCRLRCKFCVVPSKEGKAKAESTIGDIWRGEGYPKTLHLLDNDFFGNPEWRDRLREIRDGGFRVCLSQGINVRLINQEAAEAIASIQYRDTKFQQRRLYTAWDNIGDEKIFFKGVDMLEKAGIPPTHLMAYMLIGYDKNETWERIFTRFNKMVDRGILPYPMVYDQSRKDLKRFQRWVVMGLYRAVPWEEYRG